MKKQLRFSCDGKFRILCFGDLHESNEFKTEIDKAKFEDMQLLMKTAVRKYKPDLCVFMGDTYCSNDKPDEMISKIVKPITDEGIPFAVVLGNHEHDKEEKPMLDAYFSHPECLSYNDNPDITGNLNYNLTVKSSSSDKTVLNLWFMDTNNMCPSANISIYDWVHKDQIEWYERKAEELKDENGGETVPAVLFQHIPVTEIYEALREAKPWEFYQSVVGHAYRSDKRYVATDKVVSGYVGEDPCAPQYNEGQFECWKKVGDVKAAFFGHDHLNDFTCFVDGIMMGQCKTAGFRCYTDGCQSCVRIVEINENEPANIRTKVVHFKELGLKSKSLGPVKRNLNDKQSITMTAITKAAAGAAALGAAVVTVSSIFSKE